MWVTKNIEIFKVKLSLSKSSRSVVFLVLIELKYILIS